MADILELNVSDVGTMVDGDGNPLNPRGKVSPSDKEVLALADSIREIGQAEPILVKKQGGKYYVIKGHRRLCAVRDVLGRSSVLAIIDNNPLTDKCPTIHMLSSDLQDRPPHIIVRNGRVIGGVAKLVWEIIKSNMMPDNILSTLTGMDINHIRVYLKMMDCPIEVQERIAKNDLSWTTISALVNQPVSTQLEVLDKTSDKKRITAQDVKEARSSSRPVQPTMIDISDTVDNLRYHLQEIEYLLPALQAEGGADILFRQMMTRIGRALVDTAKG